MQKKDIAEATGFNKTPYIEVKNPAFSVLKGWPGIVAGLNKAVSRLNKKKKIIVVETYQGVIHEEVMARLEEGMEYTLFIKAKEYMLPENEIKKLVFNDVTEDRIFGYMTRLEMNTFFDPAKVSDIRKRARGVKEVTIIVYGTGAAYLFPESDLLIYADIARWEIQQRMRKNLVDNLGVKNKDTKDWMLLYKQGYFVDWRVCDRLKKKLFDKWDYVLDTNKQGKPKLLKGEAVLEGLEIASRRPFSVVPFFDPGPWGAKWMKEVCNLDREPQNYAWCFNCVPEENSLLLKFGDDIIEIPSINLVFRHPVQLLGDPVHARFGDEFPIRFDFLDTMEGSNLSLQVHPLTEYIQEKFGMHYTQDESYYLMDAEEGAEVFLGLKEGINKEEMLASLEKANQGGEPFDAEKYVQTWPAEKHNHFLIPAGTIHCSGKGCMVLEISATPYIFTFKLWDWGRVGMDGKPRPINIRHGQNVIQWGRSTEWVGKNLVNQIEKNSLGEGWEEERTGLHEREFIETRRHWFTEKVHHKTNGSVNVLCLVEGNTVVVESPVGAFEPFHVNYAEVFIVPALVDEYTIRPYGKAGSKKCATIKAYVRF